MKRATRKQLAHLFGKNPRPFRVHFHEGQPFETLAIDITEARENAKAAHPGIPISKIKIVRENAHG